MKKVSYLLVFSIILTLQASTCAQEKIGLYLDLKEPMVEELLGLIKFLKD